MEKVCSLKWDSFKNPMLFPIDIWRGNRSLRGGTYFSDIGKAQANIINQNANWYNTGLNHFLIS